MLPGKAGTFAIGSRSKPPHNHLIGDLQKSELVIGRAQGPKFFRSTHRWNEAMAALLL